MSKDIEAGIKDAQSYAADNSKGYELGSRDYDLGTDCSGLARRYAAKVEGVSLSSYPDMSTRTMRKVLQARGWQVLPFSVSAMKRGDLLLKEIPGGTGHVVIYIGDMRIIGAEGNWDGIHGDGDGREICERNYYTFGYNYILRWIGDDDMTDEQAKQLKFLYDHANWDDKHFSGFGNLIAQMPITYGTGKSKTTASLGDRLAYIDAHTHNVDTQLAEIKAMLSKLVAKD